MTNKEINILFFGDSVCFGQFVSVSDGWVAKIARNLKKPEVCGDANVIVMNSSVNGCTTRQALERMPYDIQAWKVDILTVQFGLNDCNYWLTDRGVPRVSPKAFAANLAEIVSRAEHFGINKIFLVTNHPTSRDEKIMPYTNTTYQESNRKYNEIIREVAAENTGSVMLIDIEKNFLSYIGSSRDKLLRLVLPDGLHLSVAGHKQYFKFVYPHFKGVVSSMSKSKAEPQTGASE